MAVSRSGQRPAGTRSLAESAPSPGWRPARSPVASRRGGRRCRRRRGAVSSVTANPARAAFARSRNSVTASYRDNDLERRPTIGIRHRQRRNMLLLFCRRGAAEPGWSPGSEAVGAAPSSRSATQLAGNKCSKLSSTRRTSLAASSSTMVSMSSRPGCSRIPSVWTRSRRYLRVVRQRRKIDEEHPVVEPRQRLACHLEGQPGLARPTRSGQRHQSMLGEQLHGLRDLVGPAHEAGELQAAGCWAGRRAI